MWIASEHVNHNLRKERRCWSGNGEKCALRSSIVVQLAFPSHQKVTLCSQCAGNAPNLRCLDFLEQERGFARQLCVDICKSLAPAYQKYRMGKHLPYWPTQCDKRRKKKKNCKTIHVQPDVQIYMKHGVSLLNIIITSFFITVNLRFCRVFRIIQSLSQSLGVPVPQNHSSSCIECRYHICRQYTHNIFYFSIIYFISILH